MFAILSFRENWKKYLRPRVRKRETNKPARKKCRRWIKEAAGRKSGWKLWPEDARAFSKNLETTGNIFQAAAKAKSAPKSPQKRAEKKRQKRGAWDLPKSSERRPQKGRTWLRKFFRTPSPKGAKDP